MKKTNKQSNWNTGYKSMILTIIMIMTAVIATSAVIADNSTEPMFQIKQVDVKVDGKSDDGLTDGATVGREAKPESTIKVEVEVENLYSRENDTEVENVDITIRLVDVDDGDDLEEQIDDFDLKADRTKSVSASFDLPLKIDEGTYDIEIEVEARDEQRIDYNEVWVISFDVEKDDHDLRIYSDIQQKEYVCGDSGTLDIEVLNLANDVEEDVKIEVMNTALGINSVQTDIELSDDVFDDDSSYFMSVPITIGDDIKAGVYPVTIKAYYNKNKLDASSSVDLIVKSCPKKTTTTTVAPVTTTTLPVQQSQNGENQNNNAGVVGGEEENEIEQIPITGNAVSQETSSGLAGDSMGLVILVVFGIVVLIAVTALITVALTKKN